MSTNPRETDVVVIGGGPTGENIAQYAHDGGLSVVMVEASLLGGKCSYFACMPSKALLGPIAVRDTTAHLQGLAPATLDREGLLARRDYWVSNYDDAGQLAWAEGAGIEVLRGYGRLVGEREVEVTTQDGPVRLRARSAMVLATGSEPVVPELLRPIHPWTSQDATGVVELPERLVIVGGGVVACEAATWLTALGSHVTMVVRDHLLGSFEPIAAHHVGKALERAGVEVLAGRQVALAARNRVEDRGLGNLQGGPVQLVLDDDRELTCDELLVATGRVPALDRVGLENVGLTSEDVLAGRLPQWLFSIGDSGAGAPLTHMGKYEARALGARLSGQQEHPAPEEVPTPQVVFTDPQVASVGLTESAAKEAGHAVVTAQVPWTSAAGASLLRDDATGAAKIVVDEGSGLLLGATFVGPGAGELVHAATIAIVGKVPVWTLRHAVPSYPTASELWLRLLEALPTTMR